MVIVLFLVICIQTYSLSRCSANLGEDPMQNLGSFEEVPINIHLSFCRRFAS